MTTAINIINEYKELKLLDRIYTRLRWRLCPFNKIESNIPKEGLIVDLGCGYGILANLLYLKSKKRKIIGMDISSKRIKIAKKSERKNKKLKFIEKDITKSNIKKVDAIVMTDFLHHIKYKDQEKLIAKLNKKLNNNGKLIILDINKNKKLKYFFTVLLDRTLNYGEPAYYRTEEDMKKILEKNGFKVKSFMVDERLPMPDILFVAEKRN